MRTSFISYSCVAILGLLHYNSSWAKSKSSNTSTQIKDNTVTAAKVEVITTRSSTANVRGGGLIRSQHGTQAKSVVGRPYINVVAPTNNAYQLVALLPGANVAMSDPFGISPHVNLSVRGLGSNSIGAVLEGMPMNDLAYYDIAPGQFADTENYAEVALQQGSADLDSPVLNAVGGLLSIHYLDPSFKSGGLASFSYGSNNMRRGFIRLETGEIGQTGVRGFVSYSNSHTDNWRGAGHDTRQHVDFKFLKEWGEENRASFLGSWNRAITSFYPQVSLDDWKQNGIHNNLNKHYDKAHPLSNENYWKLWREPMETLYVGAPVHVKFDDVFSLDVTPYAQRAYGSAPGGMVLENDNIYLGHEAIDRPLPLPEGQDASLVRSDYKQKSYRSGFTAALHAKAGWNNFTLGYWYDYSDDHEQQAFRFVDANGSAGSIWGHGNHIHLKDGRRLIGADFHTTAQINAIFIGDHISLFHDKLAMDIGFKEVMLSRVGTNNVPGPQYNVSQNSAKPLPRFGLRWNITPQDQLFFNATTNFRAPAVTTYYDTYDVTSPGLWAEGPPN
nr:TonB-dependent receptor [Aristophania vespae]